MDGDAGEGRAGENFGRSVGGGAEVLARMI